MQYLFYAVVFFIAVGVMALLNEVSWEINRSGASATGRAVARGSVYAIFAVLVIYAFCAALS